MNDELSLKKKLVIRKLCSYVFVVDVVTTCIHFARIFMFHLEGSAMMSDALSLKK